MIKYLNNNSYRDFEKKLKKIRSHKELKKFYKNFLKNFQYLNLKYKFSINFDLKYINQQLKNFDYKKKDIFFGIPFGIKDVFNTKYLKTRFGSDLFENYFPGNNARVVDIIEGQQGVTFCKTTTAEFAVHYFPEKKTLNPFDINHITGTSSSGSAVAVASGALPCALATQTAGSIIRPASFCGVLGFKPSFGALDRTGVLKTTDTLDTIGLFASDIYGIEQVFKNLIQSSNQYPYSKNFFLKKPKKKIKIGIISDNFIFYKKYDDIVKKNFDNFCNQYLKNFDVKNNFKVDFINDVHENHENIYCKSLAYYFSSLRKRKIKMSKIMNRMIDQGAKITKNKYLHSLSAQLQQTKKFELMMKNYDFLITPSTASIAPKIGKKEKKDTCLIWTYFGAPSISLPIFYDQKTGLPFGLQVITSRYNDFALLDFSNKLIKNLSKNKKR